MLNVNRFIRPKGIAKVAASIIALFVALVVFTPFTAQAQEPADRQSMYRLYNPNSGEHFFTASVEEAWTVQDAGWIYEGIGWTAPSSSSIPVYRLYNPNAGDHHYTPDASEHDKLVSVGWLDEGIGWYSDESRAVPLYRQYNPNAVTGSHNFTTDLSENAALVEAGWSDEGIAWYGCNGRGDDTYIGNYYRIYGLNVDWADDPNMWARPTRSVCVENATGGQASLSLHYNSRNCARMSDTGSIETQVVGDYASFSYTDSRMYPGVAEVVFGTGSVSLRVDSEPGRENYLSTNGTWALLKRMDDREFNGIGVSSQHASLSAG